MCLACCLGSTLLGDFQGTPKQDDFGGIDKNNSYPCTLPGHNLAHKRGELKIMLHGSVSDLVYPKVDNKYCK